MDVAYAEEGLIVYTVKYFFEILSRRGVFCE